MIAPRAEMANPDPSGTRPGPAATLLATLTGNLYLVVVTVVMAIAATAVSWLGPKGLLFYRFARVWGRGLLAASWVRVSRAFEAELDPSKQYLFMSNHQSLYDIPALLATLPGPTRFLAKRGLFQIPFFGWALSMGGFVSIDRTDLSRAGGAFREAVAGLASGGSLLVFPEGTRSIDGGLLPFKRGGFLLALKAGLPIVPVGVRGTLAVQRRGSRVIRPGRVEIRFGRPIPVADLGVRDRQRLAAEVRAEIARLADVEAPGAGEASD